MVFCPEKLKWDQNLKFTPLSEMANIPAPFFWEPPPSMHAHHHAYEEMGVG